MSLVRAGEHARIPVGRIAADTDVEIDDGTDVPPGALALGRYTVGWLRLATGARLVIDEAACDQKRSPSSGP